jgi:N-acetylated-alpha-linked acidic dipeptidase
MLKAVQDPTATFVIAAEKTPVPFLNFAPLHNSIARLNESVKNYQSAVKGKQVSRASLDEALYKTERALIRTQGLPRRDWFRHQIYAPGFYTGYGVKTLPGIREAIEQRNWKEAEEQIKIVSQVLDEFSAEIDKAAKVFGQ